MSARRTRLKSNTRPIKIDANSDFKVPFFVVETIEALRDPQGRQMALRFPGHPYYIPIIKWQAWEQRALLQTRGDVKPYVCPCIEVRHSDQHNSLMGNFQTVWGAPALIDYANPAGRLVGVRLLEFEAFLQVAKANRFPIIPVINPIDVPLLRPALLGLVQSYPEIYLRLRINGLAINHEHYTQTIMAAQALARPGNRIHLMIDFGVTPAWELPELTVFAGMVAALKNAGFSQIHVASGAFPESLAAVKAVAILPRRDWSLWAALNTNAPALCLGYSDYGTISPRWTEETLTRRGGRVAIRYARNHDWLVLRADGSKSEHSVAISSLMVTVHAASFKGRDYSYGDELIADRANPMIKKKNAGLFHFTEGWCHHLATVIKEQY
jgi:hypothetical protein